MEKIKVEEWKEKTLDEIDAEIKQLDAKISECGSLQIVTKANLSKERKKLYDLYVLKESAIGKEYLEDIIKQADRALADINEIISRQKAVREDITPEKYDTEENFNALLDICKQRWNTPQQNYNFHFTKQFKEYKGENEPEVKILMIKFQKRKQAFERITDAIKNRSIFSQTQEQEVSAENSEIANLTPEQKEAEVITEPIDEQTDEKLNNGEKIDATEESKGDVDTAEEKSFSEPKEWSDFIDEINNGNWMEKTKKEIEDKIKSLDAEIQKAKVYEVLKKSKLKEKISELESYINEKDRQIYARCAWFNGQIGFAGRILDEVYKKVEEQKDSINNSKDKKSLINEIKNRGKSLERLRHDIDEFKDPYNLNNESAIQEKLAEFKEIEDKFNLLVAEVEKIPVPQEEENEGSADESEAGVGAENSTLENHPEEENTENSTLENNSEEERAENTEQTTGEDKSEETAKAGENGTGTPTVNNIPQLEIVDVEAEATEETEKDTSEPEVENTDSEQKRTEQNSTTSDLAEYDFEDFEDFEDEEVVPVNGSDSVKDGDKTSERKRSQIHIEGGILVDKIKGLFNRGKNNERQAEIENAGETLDKDGTPVDEAGEDSSERLETENSVEELDTPKGEPIDMDKLFRGLEGGEKETKTAADGGRQETRVTVYEPQETRVTTTEEPETRVTVYKQPETGMTVFGGSPTEIANSENDDEIETIILDKEKLQGLPEGKKKESVIYYDVPFEENRQDKNEETRKEPEKPRKLTADEKNEIRQMMFEVKCTILEAGDVWIDSYSKSAIETNISRAKTILEGKILRTTNKKDLKYLSEDIQRLDQLKEEITEEFFTAQKTNSETEEAVEEPIAEGDSAENGDETQVRKKHQIRDKVRDVADKVGDKVGGVFDKFKGLRFKRGKKDKDKVEVENEDEALEETLEGENPYTTTGVTSTAEASTAETVGATPEEEIPTTGTTGTPPTAETVEGANPYATAGATPTAETAETENPYATAGVTPMAETTGATSEAETPEPVVMGGIPEEETQEGENPYETAGETPTDTSESGADNRRRERFVSEDEPWVEKPKKMGLLRRLWRFLTTPIRSIKDLIMNRHARRVMDFERLDDETLERELQNAERGASERKTTNSSRREERSFDRHPEGEERETVGRERDSAERETVGRERDSAERETEDLEVGGSAMGNPREEKAKKHRKRKFKLEQVEVDENGVAHLEDSKLLDKLVKKNGKTTKRYNVLKQVISKYPSTLRSLPPKVLEELSNANVNGVNALDDLKGTYIVAWINKVGAGKMNTNALIDEIEKFMNENRERAGETSSLERGSMVGENENEAS